MKKTADEIMKLIREGSIEDILDDEDLDDLDDDAEGTDDEGDGGEINYDDDSYVDLDDFDDDTLAEATLAIIESEIGAENLEKFITENAGMLVRDKLLTEEATGSAFKSYVVLSPEARRKRAINILKLRMARDAGDPRYKKLVIARTLVKKLLGEIRADGRYKKAETIVRKLKFKVVSNPEAAAAMKKMQTTKLQPINPVQ